MSIEHNIRSMCIHTAVYWESPVNDGFGGFIYNDPVEIKCFWQDKEQIIGKDDEKVVISRAVVYSLIDLETDGLLWLGNLDDLTTAQQSNPRSIDGIQIVKRFEKTAAMRSNSVYMRKSFLSPLLF